MWQILVFAAKKGTLGFDPTPISTVKTFQNHQLWWLPSNICSLCPRWTQNHSYHFFFNLPCTMTNNKINHRASGKTNPWDIICSWPNLRFRKKPFAQAWLKFPSCACDSQFLVIQLPSLDFEASHSDGTCMLITPASKHKHQSNRVAWYLTTVGFNSEFENLLNMLVEYLS